MTSSVMNMEKLKTLVLLKTTVGAWGVLTYVTEWLLLAIQ
jgi:hypothetical protein